MKAYQIIREQSLTISMPLLRATPILVLCAPKSIPTTLMAGDGLPSETSLEFCKKRTLADLLGEELVRSVV